MASSPTRYEDRRAARGRRMLWGLALAATAVLVGCPKRDRQASRDDDGAITLRYVVDATRPESGWVAVTLEARNLPPGRHRLMRGGNPTTTTVRKVVAHAGERKLAVTPWSERRDVWNVTTKAGDGPLRVSWQARQGGLSRHGHEGYLTASFGLVDGGVFLLPRRYFRQEVKGHGGRSDVARVSVKVKTKPGWQAVSSMARNANGELDPAIDGRWRVTHLSYSNIGLGQFDLVERRIGAVRHRIYLFSGWDPAKKKRVASGALQIARVFDEQAPFVGLPTYTTIFLPAAPDRQPVTGQFWSTGQAYSFDAYEERPRRIWELYAHRLAHAVNRYHVCGFHADDERERWFIEGWASWTEITHTLAAKVIGSEQQLIELGARYRAVVLGLKEGVEDRPVFHEAKRSYKKLTLYLHYVKGPLVVQALDYEMQQRTGGKKSVNGFVKWVYPRYRAHKKNLPLKRELEAYLGSSLDGFFRDHVDKAGFLYPLHRGFLDHARKLPTDGPDAAPALTVDGRAIGARQHRQLAHVLAKMGLKGAAAVRERLIALLLVDAEHRRRKLGGVPAEMLELADRVPGSARLLIFRHQKALLFGGDETRYRAWLAAQRKKAKIKAVAAAS